MFRLLLAVAFTVSAVAFSMANTQLVEISFIIGSPARLHLIFLLLVTFFMGAAFTGFFAMVSRLRLRKKLHLARQQMRTVYEEVEKKAEPEAQDPPPRKLRMRNLRHVD